jgi:predicted PurR-regulated permease PerM
MDINQSINQSSTDAAQLAVEKLANGSDRVYTDIQRIISKVSSMAPDAWNILVHQKAMEGKLALLEYSVTIAILLGLCVVSFFIMKKYTTILLKIQEQLDAEEKKTLRRQNSACEENVGKMITVIVSSCVFIIVSFGLIINLTCHFDTATHGYMKMQNPEYYAACEIVDAVKAMNPQPQQCSR